MHALVDTTAIHILEELAAETDALSVVVGRPLSLIAESDLNDPRLITPAGPRRLRHDRAVGTTISTTPSTPPSPVNAGLLRRLRLDGGAGGDVAQTATSTPVPASFRGRRHGRPLDTSLIPATRLLAYTCTHDQVGNRAAGDRPAQNLDTGPIGHQGGLVLGSPYTAMLFMGEEWGSTRPFQFFSSHPEPELARATAEGRRGGVRRTRMGRDTVPDPQDPATFERSKLDWPRPPTPCTPNFGISTDPDPVAHRARHGRSVVA